MPDNCDTARSVARFNYVEPPPGYEVDIAGGWWSSADASANISPPEVLRWRETDGTAERWEPVDVD